MNLLSLIREDYRANDRDWTKPGFHAIAVYRFGVMRMKVKPRLLRMPLSLLYKIGFVFCRNVYGIEIPCSAQIGRRLSIAHQGSIVIGCDVRLGDDCVIHQGVTLGVRKGSHGIEYPVLGNHVMVCVNAVVLGGVHVGDRAIIGAGSVVLRDVEADQIVVGQPARVVGSNRDRKCGD